MLTALMATINLRKVLFYLNPIVYFLKNIKIKWSAFLMLHKEKIKLNSNPCNTIILNVNFWNKNDKLTLLHNKEISSSEHIPSSFYTFSHYWSTNIYLHSIIYRRIISFIYIISLAHFIHLICNYPQPCTYRLQYYRLGCAEQQKKSITPVILFSEISTVYAWIKNFQQNKTALDYALLFYKSVVLSSSSVLHSSR
jgi:hypothetical protein